MLLFGLLCCSAFSLLAEGQQVGTRRSNANWRTRVNRLRSRPSQNALSRGQRPRAESEGPTDAPPQTWRDLIHRNNVSNEMDFINLLRTASGRQVTEGDIFSPYQTADGKRVITGGGIMATSDECSPRNMSVRLPLNYSDNQVAYYPECTMVQRCGGCTPTPFLSCQARYKEKIVLKVLRARFLYPGALSMQWEGFSSVEVERHLSCRAVCTLQPQDCRENQRFNLYQCKCLCTRFERCYNRKIWDPEICSCRCPNSGPCCAEPGQEDDRTCTSYFDHDFCECTLKSSIGAPPNATQAEIEEWMANRQARLTSTTTAVPPRRGGGCSRPCPFNFERVRLPGNRCTCTFPRPRG